MKSIDDIVTSVPLAQPKGPITKAQRVHVPCERCTEERRSTDKSYGGQVGVAKQFVRSHMRDVHGVEA